MLACWVEDPNGDYFKKHLARIPDYIWAAEDGMKMQVRIICYKLRSLETQLKDSKENNLCLIPDQPS